MGLYRDVTLRFDGIEVERCWFRHWRKFDKGLGKLLHNLLYGFESTDCFGCGSMSGYG